MNLTCIRPLVSESGQPRDRPLDGDQVGAYLDGLSVRVRPPRDLVQLVADAGYLRVGPCSKATARAVQVRVRAMACRSRSDGDTPAAAAFVCKAACSEGNTRARTTAVGRSAIGAPPRRTRGGAPHPQPEMLRDRSVPAISCEPAGDAPQENCFPRRPRIELAVTSPRKLIGALRLRAASWLAATTAPTGRGGRGVTWKAGTERNPRGGLTHRSTGWFVIRGWGRIMGYTGPR